MILGFLIVLAYVGSSEARHHKHQHTSHNANPSASSADHEQQPSRYHHPLSFDEALSKINYPSTGGYFHAYDPHSDRHNSKECSPYYEDHKTSQQSMAETLKRYKLWSGGWIGEDRINKLTSNDTLFGLRHAMEAIWNHQHPADCSKAQFLIPTEHGGGFGSELHVLINTLGIAMDMNRVLLLNPLLHSQSMWEVESPFCQSTTIGFDCFYEPWSSCTIFDALGENALEILKDTRDTHYVNSRLSSSGKHLPPVYSLNASDSHRFYTDGFLQELNHFGLNEKSMMLHQLHFLGGMYIPRSLRPLVSCSPMIPKFHYYWWRAITITYFIRPNEKTLAWIEAHRNKSFDAAILNNKMKNVDTRSGETAKNVVAVYVRRGDKSREMRICPLSEYIDGMRLLWALKYLSNPSEAVILHNKGRHDKKKHNKSEFPRIMFFASESSSVFDEMVNWLETNQTHIGTSEWYEMFYTSVFDRKGLYAEKSAAERDAGLAKQVHHPDEYLSMLLNLHHLLQADAWVCTLSSNFCRVVDELRATIAGKAGAPFVDLSEEKCDQPPCIYGGFIDLDWR